MSILQQVPYKMQTILETVADEVAVATNFVQRKRKLTGSALTQILVFGWLENPEASYQHPHRNCCHARYTSQSPSS